jgi:3-carboxy-cis,cis-muconate cycloisomerase
MPEVGELAEPFVPHRGASSTMPHKSNPVLCEAIMALSKMLRQEAGLALDTVPSDFERAGSGAWQLEWAVLPQSFTYCSAALKHTDEVLTGLRVSVDRMKENLNMSRGLVAAEHVVVALYKEHGRARSHDIIYECCREATEKKEALSEVLKRRKDVTSFLSDQDIEWYCDPANYLGLTTRLIDRMLAGR